MKYLSSICACLISCAAFGGQGTGLITFIGASHDTPQPWIFFNIENYVNHACPVPNSGLGKLIFTSDTTRGREMLAILLSAEARQMQVTVVGTGICVDQNRESVNFVFIGDPTR